MSGSRVLNFLDDYWDWLKLGGASILALGIVVTSAMIGAEFGRAMSPDYESEKATHAYLLSNARVKFSESTKTTTVTLQAGEHIYRYKYPADKLTRLHPAAELRNYRPPRRWRMLENSRVGELTGLTALTTGGLMSKVGAARTIRISSASAEVGMAMSHARFYVLMGAGIIMGVGLDSGQLTTMIVIIPTRHLLKL